MNNVTKAQAFIALHNATHKDKLRETFKTEEEASAFLSTRTCTCCELTKDQTDKLRHYSTTMVDLRHVVGIVACMDLMSTVKMMVDDVYTTFILVDNVLVYDGDDGVFDCFKSIINSGISNTDTWTRVYLDVFNHFDVNDFEQSLMDVVKIAYEIGYADAI